MEEQSPSHGIKDLSKVLTSLKPLESKWHELGIHLGIKDETLESIEADHHSVGRRFSKMVSFWQRNEQNPSWEKLADAVEKVGEYSNVVRSIRGIIDPSNKASSSSIASIIEDQDSGRGSSAHSSSDSEHSEQDVFDTSSLSPGCGCGQCDIHKMCTVGCPQPDYTKRLPILRKLNGGRSVSESAEIAMSMNYGNHGNQYLVDSFEKETLDIRTHFGSLIYNTRKSFTKHVDVVDVALYLIGADFPLLAKKADEIEHAENMTSLFFKIKRHACSWFNFDIIRKITKEFGKSEDHERLAEYERHFETFAKQRLPQGMTHVELGSKAGMTGCKKLVIKVDREWESISIGELERLCREFAKTLQIDRKNLYLADVNEGCIMLTLMIPDEIANTLSKCRLTSTQKQMLENERVVRLTCGRLKWFRTSSTNQSSSDTDEEERESVHKKKIIRLKTKSDTTKTISGSASFDSLTSLSCLVILNGICASVLLALALAALTLTIRMNGSLVYKIVNTSTAFSQWTDHNFSTQNATMFCPRTDHNFSTQNATMFSQRTDHNFDTWNAAMFSQRTDHNFSTRNGTMCSQWIDHNFSTRNGTKFSQRTDHNFSTRNGTVCSQWIDSPCIVNSQNTIILIPESGNGSFVFNGLDEILDDLQSLVYVEIDNNSLKFSVDFTQFPRGAFVVTYLSRFAPRTEFQHEPIPILDLHTAAVFMDLSAHNIFSSPSDPELTWYINLRVQVTKKKTECLQHGGHETSQLIIVVVSGMVVISRSHCSIEHAVVNSETVDLNVMITANVSMNFGNIQDMRASLKVEIACNGKVRKKLKWKGYCSFVPTMYTHKQTTKRAQLLISCGALNGTTQSCFHGNCTCNITRLT